jgi:2-oxoglutarate ferredoxin oxidoreductase subunit delta
MEANKSRSLMPEIYVSRNRCKRCGVCIELCPSHVYVASEEGYPEPRNIERCTQCQLCELWCPDYAIEIEVHEDER